MNIEDLILDMADLVCEVRYLREENLRLAEELYERRKQTHESYDSSQRMVANMLCAALSNAHARMGDEESARMFADKITTE